MTSPETTPSPGSASVLHTTLEAVRISPAPSKELMAWQTVQQSLSRGESALLLAVVDASSGSPGRQGFKMVITENGESSGTIGGGVMEYRFIQGAPEILRKSETTATLFRQEHTREAPPAERSGMICSGFQTVVSCPLRPHQKKLIDQICDSLKNRTGSFTLSPQGIAINTQDTPIHPRRFTPGPEPDSWSYTERLSPHQTMHVVGGGHVGSAVSRVMRMLDFHVKVYDHRKDLALLEQNLWADEKIIGPYSALAEHIPEGQDQFVTVVSTTFKTDQAALKALAGRNFAYLGVMGSSTKISAIREALDADGVAWDQLRNLRAPIGLPIRSHTAEEIAVSIAAEVIQIKNNLP